MDHSTSNNPNPARHKGRATKYPWHEWSKPGKHTVTQGVDFDCSIPSFITLIHSKLHTPYRPKGFPEGASITYAETSVENNTVTFEYHYVEFGEEGDH